MIASVGPGPGHRRGLRAVTARRLARRTFLRLQPLGERTGLSVPAWRAWEYLLGYSGRNALAGVASDGLPLPPTAQRVRVIADPDGDLFLASGASEHEQLVALASEHGLAADRLGRVLDFGCGCGRIARHWRQVPGVEIHAADHDPRLIEWVDRSLPFVQCHRNALSPPLPYPAGHFDLVYAISVFTHLSDRLGLEWMTEMRRVIRCGGLLLFSVLPSEHRDRLRGAEQAAYDRGELVVQFKEGEGTNLCAAYHPEPYVRRMASGFELLDRRAVGLQDVWVAQRASSL